MAGFSSRHGTIAFAKQTAKGTPATVPTIKFFAAGAPSLAPVKDRARFAMTDGGRDLGPGFTSQMRVEGDIPVYAHFDGFALLAYAALGANADAGVAPDYTHTATPANDVPYLTIWRMVAGNIFERYDDCKVSSLRLEGQAGSPWTVTLSVVGISSTFEASDTTLAALASSPLLFSESKDQLKFGGTAQRLSRLSLEIDNGLAPYQADDYTLFDVNPGGREISLSFTTLYQGPTSFPDYRTHYYGSATGTALSPAVGTNDVDIEIVRAANKKIHIDLPQVTFASVPVQMDPGGDPIEIEVACQAEKPASGSICQIITSDQSATV